MFSDTKPSSTKMFASVKTDPLSNLNPKPKPKEQNQPQTQKNQNSLNSFFSSQKKEQKIQEPEKDIVDCILIMGDVHIPNRIDSI